MLAAELHVGDVMQTRGAEVIVTHLKKRVLETKVIEVLFEDDRSSIYASSLGTPESMCVKIFGAHAPVKNACVEILTFQRFDKFGSIILENDALRSCRDALEEMGLSVDLGLYGLGSGKLLVRADQGQHVIKALVKRNFTPTNCLKNTNVVVSSEFKPILLEEVRRLAPRKNPVVKVELLELAPVSNDKTFVGIGSCSMASVVTQSTTDIHLGRARNPRRKVRAQSCHSA